MKVLLTMVMVTLVSIPGAMAADLTQQSVSYTNPITGFHLDVVNVKSNDAFRGNQSVCYAVGTDQELVTQPNGKKRWQVTSKLLAHDSASSTGIVNGFFVGGFAGLAQGGGIAGGAALLRPSMVSQVGGGATQSQGQGQRQRQGQGQLQGQQQGQAAVNTNTNLNTNVNTNTPVANAIQTQGQGQATGPFSPVTVLP